MRMVQSIASGKQRQLYLHRFWISTHLLVDAGIKQQADSSRVKMR